MNVSFVCSILEASVFKNTNIDLQDLFIAFWMWQVLFLATNWCPNRVIEIDKRIIGKRKYIVGRAVRQKRIICMYTINQIDVIKYIHNRSSETLTSENFKHVKPGSYIWTELKIICVS